MIHFLREFVGILVRDYCTSITSLKVDLLISKIIALVILITTMTTRAAMVLSKITVGGVASLTTTTSK